MCCYLFDLIFKQFMSFDLQIIESLSFAFSVYPCVDTVLFMTVAIDKPKMVYCLVLVFL